MTAKSSIGKRYGNLVVLSLSRRGIGRQGQTTACAECQCDCGGTVNVLLSNLRTGNTTSCGCVRKEQTGSRFSTHRLRDHPLYGIWADMRNRCQNEVNSHYADYGGRGIKVCERWDDFAAFLADMGNRPSAKHSIGRIDNDGPYAPENCRWETRSEQNKNKRNNRRLSWKGETLVLADWARRFGVNPSALKRSIDRRGEQEAMRTAEERANERQTLLGLFARGVGHET